MKQIKVKIDGITLYAPKGYFSPKEVRDCCGAGRGMGEILVPDTIFGVRISRACHIHDHAWDVASEEDFTFTNFMFLANIMILIWHGSNSKIMYWIRSYRAMTYFNAVQVVGKKHFMVMKAAQRRAKKAAAARSPDYFGSTGSAN